MLPASSTVQEGKKIQTTAEKGDDCLVVTPDFENLHLERANPAANFLNDDRQISQVFFVSFVLGISVTFCNFYHQHMAFRRKTRGCSRLPLEVYIVTSDLKLQLSYNITLDIKYTSQRAHWLSPQVIMKLKYITLLHKYSGHF